MSLKYRPEIDGLRAIAVLSVILFHLQVAGFAGGFIGVDVFFVISGYLITGILVKEYEIGVFSLVNFYKRRINRILPVALFSGSFVIFVSYFLFGSELYYTTNDTFKKALFFCSNFLLSKKQNYFSSSLESNPLLHTWSLSVEEQFYLLYPLLLIFSLKSQSANRTKIWLLSLAVVSFCINYFFVEKWHKEVFYWPFTRAWEFLVGALGFFVVVKPLAKNVENILSIIGVALICISVLLFHCNLFYPGLYALMPVFGTLLILTFLKPSTFFYRVFTTPLLLYVGKISYSLYMWHWPVLVFLRYLIINENTSWFNLLFLVIVFLISSFSYKFIEQPFRNTDPQKFSGKAVFLLLASAVIYIAASFVPKNTAAFAAKEVRQYYEEMNQQDTIWVKMRDYEKISRINYLTDIKPFRLGNVKEKSSVLIWGDSHARTLATGIAIMNKQNIPIDVFTQSACPPLLNIRFVVNEEKRYWFNENVKNYIINHPEVRVVILTARWASYYNMVSLNAVIKQNSFSDKLFLPEQTQHKQFTYGLSQTINWLTQRHIKVVITTPMPDLRCTVPEIITLKKIFALNDAEFELPMSEFLRTNSEIITVINSLSDKQQVYVFDTGKGLKSSNNRFLCFANDGRPIYRDNGHLSALGVVLSGNGILDFVSNIQ